jgi:hypothetical protein
MERINILAHRGCWDENNQPNSFEALKSALSAGFGIETDFRDCNGEIVVSHDPPKGNPLAARTFFELYADLGAVSRIAINIKADGLQDELATLIAQAEIPMENCFAFDMAVPDALGYISIEIPTYTRLSEYEVDSAFLDLSAGVWVDNFTGRFAQVAVAERLLAGGNRVCIVSSELHKRDHKALWNEISDAGIHKHPFFELCTDFPEAAHQFFLNEDGN